MTVLVVKESIEAPGGSGMENGILAEKWGIKVSRGSTADKGLPVPLWTAAITGQIFNSLLKHLGMVQVVDTCCCRN